MCINAEKQRDQARVMYVHFGYSRQQIADELKINPNTLASWIRRGAWDEITGMQRARAALDERLSVLYLRDNKTEADFREIEFLEKSVEKHALAEAKAKAYEYRESGTTDKDFEHKKSYGKRGRKPNKVKNHLEPEQIEALEAAFLAGFERENQDPIFGINTYGHQKTWYDNIHQRIRNILKSRQIGATLYFSHESIVDAFKNGRNKNFLSASKAQAHIFRDYMVAFVYAVTGVELKGADKIVLSNGAVLKFHSTNSSTAQGSTGDVIVDEYFWIRDFVKLRKLATAMASQKKWRITYISTPSTINHQAYPFWSGEFYNKGKAKKDQITLDVSHKALKDGKLCEDGQWRQIVTIFDAEALGFDLFDIEQLKIEYPGDEFTNLFLCRFIDDTSSVFKYEQLAKCMVDSVLKWKDVERDGDLVDVGDLPVWVGYDPSRTTDAASLVVIAPPLKPGGKFRLLEKHHWTSESFEYQANRIQEILKRFNVTKMAMDITGIGYGVYELVRKFYPRVMPIHYSSDSKRDLVTKGKDVIGNGRFEFDSGWVDVAKAFMTIYQTSTDNGTITYKARRTETTGHADVAFAILHAMQFEPLASNHIRQGRVVNV